MATISPISPGTQGDPSSRYDLDNAGRPNQVHAAVATFRGHADPFRLAVVVEAAALKELFDASPHATQQCVTTRHHRAQWHGAEPRPEARSRPRPRSPSVTGHPLRAILPQGRHVAHHFGSMSYGQ